MEGLEKRYRFQIQFDTYADSDKEAVQVVKDMIAEMKDSNNELITYMAENYFASLNHREIDHQELSMQLFDEQQIRLRDIKENLPF
jgi:hypothetical protein